MKEVLIIFLSISRTISSFELKHIVYLHLLLPERRVIEPPPIIQISLNQVSSEQEWYA